MGRHHFGTLCINAVTVSSEYNDVISQVRHFCKGYLPVYLSKQKLKYLHFYHILNVPYRRITVF